MDQKFKFYVEPRLYTDSYAVYGLMKGDAGYVGRIHPLTIEMVKEGLEIREPFLDLNSEDAQGLFNQFWNAGFRPKDGTGNGGHIDALKYHLEDMRKLAFMGVE